LGFPNREGNTQVLQPIETGNGPPAAPGEPVYWAGRIEAAPVATQEEGTMTSITEIAPDVFRISIFVPEINLEFSHFLVRDDEPLLFHAGLRSMFPMLREAASRLMDVSKIRHIGFSHFESDECGGLNHWLEIAPESQPVCGLVGAMVSVNDFAVRPARVLTAEDLLPTGRYRFRFIPTPHVPHGWDAGLLFEETERTLYCSDLFHQWGHREPTTADSIMDRCKSALLETEAGPFANFVPYTRHTGRVLESLAQRGPKTLAAMHGSTYYGDGAQALRELASVMREVLGPEAEPR
jgi:flavorubredoxin